MHSSNISIRIFCKVRSLSDIKQYHVYNRYNFQFYNVTAFCHIYHWVLLLVYPLLPESYFSPKTVKVLKNGTGILITAYL